MDTFDLVALLVCSALGLACAGLGVFTLSRGYIPLPWLQAAVQRPHLWGWCVLMFALFLAVQAVAFASRGDGSTLNLIGAVPLAAGLALSLAAQRPPKT
ncbi:hypothetical protein ABZ930_32020 [Streptomyces sp. NPDC046716]|uniref:hypothetical protein n=1 Tax=Streptomyces sp. NPDC046716 TaxID=3157093 RepID=UPI0033D555E1